jgi:hypothetical protein
MLPETQKAALRAAAKIAFFSTVMGCGGAVDTPAGSAANPETSDTSPGGGQTPTGVASSEGGSGSGSGSDDDAASGAVDAATPIPDAVAITTCDNGSSQLACCEAQLNATFPDASGWRFGTDAGASPETTACCEVLQSYYDHAEGGMSFSWGSDSNLRGPCCFGVLGMRTGGTCTPWGPPVPPAMPKRMARELLVA